MDTVYHRNRTRPATYVPKRIWYVLNYLKRQLTPDKPKAISNKTIQKAIRFGSEGEVSQIMRWLSGELPTMGRWAYGILQSTEQRYRFIERERMPSGGYSLRLLSTPEPIAPSTPAEPEAIQLSFLDDPSMIPPAPHQEAETGGSFSDMAPDRLDRAHRGAVQRRSQKDHPKGIHEESNKQQHGALSQKYDWSEIATTGIEFLPIRALEKAGITPDVFQAADRKIATRCEYDRAAQIRILIRNLLDHQPIYSASEIAARSSKEPRHVQRTAQPARSARTRRRSRADSDQRPADPAPAPDYDAILAEWRAANA